MNRILFFALPVMLTAPLCGPGASFPNTFVAEVAVDEVPLEAVISLRQRQAWGFSVSRERMEKMTWSPESGRLLSPKEALAVARKSLVGDKAILPREDPLVYTLCSVNGGGNVKRWYWVLAFHDDGPRTGSGIGNIQDIPVMLDGTMPDMKVIPVEEFRKRLLERRQRTALSRGPGRNSSDVLPPGSLLIKTPAAADTDDNTVSVGSALCARQEKTYAFSISRARKEKMTWTSDAALPLSPKEALAMVRGTFTGARDILPKDDPFQYRLRPLDYFRRSSGWIWELYFKDPAPAPNSEGRVLVIPVLMDGTMPDIRTISWEKKNKKRAGKKPS